ncbi:Reverse transcriptase (RNA-dependent DNA polymerase) [Nesidiocoris tenuis]|nr:Reverse transcriptase (RNA-dependent DNA polymerase) [Nesidiocoris tenuis]
MQEDRAIALIPLLAKVFEKVLLARLWDFIGDSGILAEEQYGFRCGRTTQQAAAALVRGCFGGLEERKKVGAWFLDLSKAFDCLSPVILVEKLRHYGFEERATSLVSSYLDGWNQFVDVSGRCSSLRSIRTGVRQGSNLRPVLYLLYVNDLPHMLWRYPVKSFLFADDTAFMIAAPDLVELQESADFVGPLIAGWCCSNRLTLNQQKTQELILDLRGRSAAVVEYLGLVIDSRLSWRPHCERVAGRETGDPDPSRSVRPGAADDDSSLRWRVPTLWSAPRTWHEGP